MLPAEAIATLVARTTDVLMIDVMQHSHDVLALLKTAKTEQGPNGRIPVIVVAAPDPPTSRCKRACIAAPTTIMLLPHDHDRPAAHSDAHLCGAASLCRGQPAPRPETPRNGRHPPAQRDPGQVRRSRSTTLVKENSQTVHRFIPREFLDMLERKSLADVKLGDHMQKEMTVFFSDIRDFTQMSERLTPAENFSFLTSYLRNVTPDHPRARAVSSTKYLR